MRDLALLSLLPLMLYAMAKRPFIALGMWIWTAMFFPNAWVYGVASGIRYNLLFTGVAILGYTALKNKPKIQFGLIGALVMLFFAWTSASTLMTVGHPEITWNIWNRFFKVVLLFVFVVLIMDKKLHIDFFLWCVVLSIGFYGSLEALKFVASGGGHKIAGFVGHVLGDRNELALSFVMTLPICLYLLNEYGKESKLIKLMLTGLIMLLVIGVIGTQSRGGFLALLVLAGYLFHKSDRKVMLSILTLAIAGAASTLVTEEWSQRMNTINNAEEDDSFMGRVVAWKLSFILAMKNPFFGGGFKSLEQFPVWSWLSQDFFSFSFFYTGDALPDPYVARAAHSIYFQVLGEHGFAGLVIYLSLIIASFRVAGKVSAAARKAGAPDWIPRLATTLQLIIFAFCVGGAALSFAYFELVFAIFGIILVLQKRILASALSHKAPDVRTIQVSSLSAPTSGPSAARGSS